MESVKTLVKEIKEGLAQQSSSQKDEIRVMRAMLNDKDYVVDVYAKEGVVGTVCPAQEARQFAASVISSAAKVSQAEAAELADNYEFKKSDAVNMINISKAFVNPCVQPGRKLPLGGRAESNVALLEKEVKGGTTTYPKKVGVDAEGKAIYENPVVKIKPHKTMRVIGKSPEWV